VPLAGNANLHTIRVQYAVTNAGTTFILDDWDHTVELSQ
jgi:hypothetical protein